MNEPKKNETKKKKKWIKRGIGAVIGAVLLIAIAVAAMPKPIAVETAQVQRGNLKTTIEEDGKTRVVDRFVISTPIAGNLERVNLHAGDTVEKGSIVAQIFPLPPPLLDARSLAQAEAQFEAAKARKKQTSSSIEQANINLNYARKDLQRQKLLAKSNGISKQSLEQAEQAAKSAKQILQSTRFGARVAEHELELTQVTLDYMHGESSKKDKPNKTTQMKMKSPVSGRVLKVFKRDEGAVSLGTPLLEIGDPQALEIVVDVLSTDAVAITKNASVEIKNWGSEKTLQGHVLRVEPAAFTRVSALGVEEQRVNVIVGIDSPYEDWKNLGDGYRTEVGIVVSEQIGVLKAPIGALFRKQNVWMVFVNEEGTAKATPVTLGARNDREAEIVEGLADGQSVILYPSDTVQDGVSIKSTLQ